MRRLIYLWIFLLAGAQAWATTPSTITIDGDMSDWSNDELVWSDSSSDSNWDYNELYEMWATWDNQKFYFAIVGQVEQANSYSTYFDTGGQSTCTDLSTVAWEKQLEASGWEVDVSVQASGQPDHDLYRVYGEWDQDEITNSAQGFEISINASTGVLEVAVPWNIMYPNGIPAGAEIRMASALTGLFEWDAGDIMPDQTVGPISDGISDVIDQLVTLTIDADGDGVPESGWHPNTNSDGGNQPPTVSLTADPISGAAPLEVEFFGFASDPDVGDIISPLQWTLGDGTTMTGDTFKHTYTKPGRYRVTVTANDSSGAQGVDSTEIIVQPPAGQTRLRVSTNSNIYREGDLLEATMEIETGAAPINGANIFILLDIYGQLFFWPSWVDGNVGVDFDTRNLQASTTIDETFFTLPVGPIGDFGPLYFYGGVFDAAFQPVSDIQIAEFRFAAPLP